MSIAFGFLRPERCVQPFSVGITTRFGDFDLGIFRLKNGESMNKIR